MLFKETSLRLPMLLLLGIAVLTTPRVGLAQHSGGGGGGGASGGGRPSGVSQKDDLGAFHRALAMQASERQRELFAAIIQDEDNAAAHLRAIQARTSQIKPVEVKPVDEKSDKPAGSAEPAGDQHNLFESIAALQRHNQDFVKSFSPAQKSILKDITKRLAREESELVRQAQAFDRTVQSAKPADEQSAAAAGVDKALASFRNEEQAIANEMSIVIAPEGANLAFKLPATQNSQTIAGQSISVPVSGDMVRTSTESGHNIFHFMLGAGLYDFQQNIAGILRPALSRSPSCGERVEIKQAQLVPAPPSGVVTAQLHFERWICATGSPTEASGGDGTIEVKLTPTVADGKGLALASEIVRVDATGFLKNMLRSGDLGEGLRDQIAATVLSVLREAANPKVALPPAAQESVSLRKAEFQNAGSDKLGLMLEGELRVSEEDTKLIGEQLTKQSLSLKQAQKEASSR
jgi:hypothetical protein